MLKILLGGSLLLWPVHSWYSQDCCSSTHCKPVPCDQLSEENGGKWRWGDYLFDALHVHPSQDKHCHVCVNGPLPLCVYIQNGV